MSSLLNLIVSVGYLNTSDKVLIYNLNRDYRHIQFVQEYIDFILADLLIFSIKMPKFAI